MRIFDCVECIQIYKCFCDPTRLRILNLLIDGPLCVCHIHTILDAPQPKVSRQLNLMKKLQVLEAERSYNWTLYRLSEEVSPVLEQNLKCLQDLRNEDAQFKSDLKLKAVVLKNWTKEHNDCPHIISEAIKAKNCC